MVFTGRTHAIKRVQFGILGPDEIRNMSVTQKTNARERAVDAGISKYETYLDGKGVYGGVNDPRMGSLDDKEDPGHFGHIELARPCYHLGYLKETLMVLRCVCFHCSRLMADPSDYRVQAAQKLKSQRRLEAMHALCRTQKRCEFATKEELDAAILEGGDPEQASYGCGALQPAHRSARPARRTQIRAEDVVFEQRSLIKLAAAFGPAVAVGCGWRRLLAQPPPTRRPRAH